MPDLDLDDDSNAPDDDEPRGKWDSAGIESVSQANHLERNAGLMDPAGTIPAKPSHKQKNVLEGEGPPRDVMASMDAANVPGRNAASLEPVGQSQNKPFNMQKFLDNDDA